MKTHETEASGNARRATAPDVLLSILAGYVAPGVGGAWQETLVSAIELFGHSTAAARQATARAVREGALVAHRSGRRSWLQLTEGAAQMLRSGAALTGDPASLPTGLWDIFVVRSVGDAGTAPKHHQRVQMLLGGLGRISPDVWIAPSTSGSAMVRRALQDEDGISVIVLRSEIAYPEARDVVEVAWDLMEVRGRYGRLVEDFSTLTPETDTACFVAWTDLQRDWRDCMRRDPGLPANTLPSDWPRPTAERLVAQRRHDWSSRAAAAFAELGADLPAPPPLDV